MAKKPKGFVVETGKNHPGSVMWIGDGLLGMTPYRNRATVFGTQRKAQIALGKKSANYGLTIVPV
jgi:hypothetical protein